MRRREFLITTSTGVLLSACGESAPAIEGETLVADSLTGAVRKEEGAPPIPGATWYTAEEPKAGFTYTFPAGALANVKYLTTDMLVEGNRKVAFGIRLREGEDGRQFNFNFSTLTEIGLRVRMPLDLVDQNRWGIDREGAFLKPRVWGDRVDLDKVDRMEFVVVRMTEQPVRWCMTEIIAAPGEVPYMEEPVLTKGPLLDELGQSTIHDWPGKTKSVEETTARIQSQFDRAPQQAFPEGWSRWGGWKAKRLSKGSGFFGVAKSGGRWWLVDPEGYAFWSTGVDCVRVDADGYYGLIRSALTWVPEDDPDYKDIFETQTAANGREMKSIRYLAANMIRTFGSDGWRDKWAATALGELKRLRFNTVGNWSEWKFATEAQFPYVRPMSFRGRKIQSIYRDFPDVFDPNFESEAADYAAQLSGTKDDPAFLGYFLMNEPQWGFSSELPAEGMLFVTEQCHTRTALAEWLKQKYTDDAALAAAWKLEATFAKVASGKWHGALSDEARPDLEAFSIQMATRYFQGLSEACRTVDPNHLNLGMRWQGVPPMWAVEGMKSLDVFSMNCYLKSVPREVTDRIHELLKMPVLIGEWHFGALDAGLPTTGVGPRLKDQTDRAKAYRVYIEDAAANPNCVGTHWFTLYDQSAIGRFDGENYNIGFLDICNREQAEICAGGMASHERIYEVAAGSAAPFDDKPEYLTSVYV